MTSCDLDVVNINAVNGIQGPASVPSKHHIPFVNRAFSCISKVPLNKAGLMLTLSRSRLCMHPECLYILSSLLYIFVQTSSAVVGTESDQEDTCWHGHQSNLLSFSYCNNLSFSYS